MSLDDVMKEVAMIRTSRGDDEIAHSMEDTLHSAVLKYYADGGTDPALAKAALTTASIRFSRWFA